MLWYLIRNAAAVVSNLFQELVYMADSFFLDFFFALRYNIIHERGDYFERSYVKVSGQNG